MQKYEHNLTANTSGVLRPLSGASIVVTDGASGLPASIYSDNGTGPLQQPLLTNNDGYFGFYAADGKYTLTFTSPRFETFTREIVLDDPLDDPYATLAQLSAPTGSSMVNHGDKPVRDVLEEIKQALKDLAPGASYTLPPATASALGGVKIGAGLSIDNSGVISAPGGVMVLLGAITVGVTVAQIDFLSLATAGFDKLIIDIHNIQLSGSSDLFMRLAAGGVLIPSITISGPTEPGGTHTANSQIKVDSSVIGGSYVVELGNINAPTLKRVGVRGSKHTSNGSPRFAEGYTGNSDPFSGFRLYPATSSIVFMAGTVRVYGIKNS